MSQRTVGLYAGLSAPWVYRVHQRVVGNNKLRKAALAHLDPRPGQRLLDIGCGTGDISAELPGVDYVGFDLSDSYIKSARKRYGQFGTFHVADVADVDLAEFGTFDMVLAHGVLHHVSDDTARRLCAIASSALAPTGRFVTVDGCFDTSQSRAARYMVSKDRGQSIRTLEGYREIAAESFDTVDAHLLLHAYRIPYTLAVLVATAPKHSWLDVEASATEGN